MVGLDDCSRDGYVEANGKISKFLQDMSSGLSEVLFRNNLISQLHHGNIYVYSPLDRPVSLV